MPISGFMKAFAASLITVFLFTGCGSSAETNLNPAPSSESVENVPKWFLNPPEDPSYLFGTGSATSRSMQMAVDKASMTARQNIASALETNFDGLTKQFQEETGTGEDSEILSQFTQAQKAVVTEVLNGVSTEEREIFRERGIYRSYILMSMPIGRAATELLERVKQNRAMYTRFRATQSYDELEEEAAKVEEEREERNQQQREYK